MSGMLAFCPPHLPEEERPNFYKAHTGACFAFLQNTPLSPGACFEPIYQPCAVLQTLGMMCRHFLFLACTSLSLLSTPATSLPPFGHSLRPYFFFGPNTTQFNHGAYGSTPKPVVESQYKFVAEMEASIDNFMNGATGYRQCILDARATFSAMINTPFNDTVLVDNASEAINAILRNFEPPLGPDEYLLDLSTAYGPFQGLYEWLGARQGLGVLMANVTWPVTGPESFTTPLKQALAFAQANALHVRVAVISHISAYPSVLLPVKELVELLHSAGIPVVVDGAHALGNIPIDVINGLGNPEYYMVSEKLSHLCVCSTLL